MSEPKPKPFQVRFTEEDRAGIEEYRKLRGLRSEADAVRDIVRHAVHLLGAQWSERDVAAIRQRVAENSLEVPAVTGGGVAINKTYDRQRPAPGSLLKKR